MHSSQKQTLCALALLISVCCSGFAQPIAAVAENSQQTTASELASKAAVFLRSSQAEDGSFSGYAGPGVTALVTTSLLRNGYTSADPTVARGIEYVLKHVQEDGGVYAKGSAYRNYETSLAVLCLSEVNEKGKHDSTIAAANEFLKGLQWDEKEGHGPDSLSYGGGGYGKHSRPDLSNTSFLIDALIAAGNGPDDPAVQRALIFVSRTQNLESKHNATPFAGKVGDGGFYYTPAAGGTSQAGETPNGGLRSYGSMTYAGLKSMLYAGVDADDPRAKAAYSWIQKHFTLVENPGMGQAGVFYYYHTFAKALDAIGEDLVVDQRGNSHDWRSELVAKLAELQRPDGSWINGNERWLEADPNLATGYSLLALSYCRESAE